MDSKLVNSKFCDTLTHLVITVSENIKPEMVNSLLTENFANIQKGISNIFSTEQNKLLHEISINNETSNKSDEECMQHILALSSFFGTSYNTIKALVMMMTAELATAKSGLEGDLWDRYYNVFFKNAFQNLTRVITDVYDGKLKLEDKEL